jgi:peptide/nickel transport system substrate-binding protein
MCNTPLSTTAGSAAATTSVADARAELQKTGYHGEPVVMMIASDNPVIVAAASVISQAMKQAGFNVDEQNMDWGTVLARRAKKEGWAMFPVYSSGFDMASPLTHFYVSNNCVDYPGWSCDSRISKLLPEFAAAATPEDQRKVAAEIQTVEYETVPSVMWGQFTEPAAYSKTLTGLIQSSIPIFWGVDKASE